jgi:phosphonatase-like hydrolase
MPNTPSESLAFDLAVLDIAGTTVEEHQAVYAALGDSVTAAGASPSEADLQRWMGADKHEAIEAMLSERAAESPTDAEVSTVYDDFRARLRAAYATRPPEPLPGVEAAFVAMRSAGMKVALTTGFSREVTDDLLQSLGWSVACDGREGTVDAVVCAEEVGRGRPAPYMIFEAMRRTGADDVRRVLVAGDTTRDLGAGTRAGAGAVVGVLSGAMDAAMLGREPHTHLLSGVAEIPSVLGLTE